MLIVLYFASLALSTFGASLVALFAHPKPVIKVVNRDNAVFISWAQFQPPPNVLKYVVKYREGQREFVQETDYRAKEVRLLFVRGCKAYQAKMMYRTISGDSPYSDEHPFDGPKLEKPPFPDFRIKPHSLGRIARWEVLDGDYRVYKYTIIGRSSEDGLEAEVSQDAPPNVNSLILDQFDPNRGYNITMTATNECWTSDESDPVSVDAIPEPKPPIVTVPETSNHSITLLITPPEDDLWLDSFVIEYSTPTGIQQITKPSNSFRVVDLTTGLEPCFNHTISVRAVNAAGQSEPTVIHATLDSDEIPSQPVFTEFTISPSNRYLVHWTTTSARPLVAHRIEYGFDLENWHVTWTDGNSQSADLGRLQKCRDYNIQIWAANQCGWSKSAATVKQFILPQVPPSVPQNLSGTGTAEEFSIIWTNPSPDEDVEAYDLLLVPANQPSQSYWVEGKSTSIPLHHFQQGLRYDVRLNARNACGWSTSGQWKFTFNSEGNLV